MAKWGEIKCERCAAPPIALWDALARALEESDAREARLEAKLAKAVEFIEDLTGCEWPYDEDAKRILAELKGQNDE